MAIAIDTSAAIDVLRQAPAAAEWLRRFGRIYLPVPVVAELIFGAHNSPKPQLVLQPVEAMVREGSVLPLTVATAEHHAQLRLFLKKKGRPIPQNDLWIAACCVEHDLPLLSYDGHFDELPQLKRVNSKAAQNDE